MKRPAAPMTVGFMLSATERGAGLITRLLQRAKSIEEDTGHDIRKAVSLCKACFYVDRIGGAAITTRPCMSCSEEQTYASTDTDVLCEPCARAGKLCKHCGADMELRTRRRAWPVAANQPNKDTQK